MFQQILNAGLGTGNYRTNTGSAGYGSNIMPIGGTGTGGTGSTSPTGGGNTGTGTGTSVSQNYANLSDEMVARAVASAVGAVKFTQPGLGTLMTLLETLGVPKVRLSAVAAYFAYNSGLQTYQVTTTNNSVPVNPVITPVVETPLERYNRQSTDGFTVQYTAGQVYVFRQSDGMQVPRAICPPILGAILWRLKVLVE